MAAAGLGAGLGCAPSASAFGHLDEPSTPPALLCACRDSVLVGLHLVMVACQLLWPSQAPHWLEQNALLSSHPLGLWLLVAVFTLQASGSAGARLGQRLRRQERRRTGAPRRSCARAHARPRLCRPTALLQLRFTLQVPALLLVYATNILALPAACQQRAAPAAGSVSACVAAGCVVWRAAGCMPPRCASATPLKRRPLRPSPPRLRCSGVRLLAIAVLLPLLAVWMLEIRARFAFASLHSSQRAA